jgi:hypothetical protein
MKFRGPQALVDTRDSPEMPWCAVNHRRNDWVSRSLFTGEFEVVIMIEVAIEEMVGSD